MTGIGASEGAQLDVRQTNNADFGRTDESVQQLAIARIRAIETGAHGRQHLDGRHERDHLPRRHDVDQQLEPYEPGVMVDDVPAAHGDDARRAWAGVRSSGSCSFGGLLVLGAGRSAARRTDAQRRPETGVEA